MIHSCVDIDDLHKLTFYILCYRNTCVVEINNVSASAFRIDEASRVDEVTENPWYRSQSPAGRPYLVQAGPFRNEEQGISKYHRGYKTRAHASFSTNGKSLYTHITLMHTF